MFNFVNTHSSWHKILTKSLAVMDQDYLNNLFYLESKTGSRTNSQLSELSWLPGKEKIFNAFSLPLSTLKYILFGESPYPRQASANGYAFWDARVKKLWAGKNLRLSKEVNRATSLRNFIKMLLQAHNIDYKNPDNSNQYYIQTLDQLFQALLDNGFLLLNASLIFRDKSHIKEDAQYWRVFINILLTQIYKIKPQTELIFLGKIAAMIDPYLISQKLNFKKIYAEHPYNLSFINNPVILNYFKKFNLLEVN